MIMEYCYGGDLQQQINKKGKVSTEYEACRLFAHLIKALEYCHFKLNICHRDVKPENLLFDNVRSRNLKLVDFGLATALSQSSYELFNFKPDESGFPPNQLYYLKGSCGTPLYSAPEIFDALYDGIKVDLWSAGVVLYVLFALSFIFNFSVSMGQLITTNGFILFCY